MVRLIPPEFDDPHTEAAFRLHYARTSHNQAVVGLILGFVLALTAIALFLAAAPASGNCLTSSSLLAACTMIALVLGLALVRLPPSRQATQKDYLHWLIIPGALALFVLVPTFVAVAIRPPGAPPAARIFLVAALALWLFCIFARPLSRVAILVGLSFSVACMLPACLAEGVQMLFTAPYFVIAGVSAVSAAVGTERQARALFARTRELEAAQRELLATTERAIRSRDSKSRILLAVSHDLRQPLLGADLILAGFPGQQSHPDPCQLRSLRNAIRALHRGVDSILAAATQDDAVIARRLEPVDLSRLVAGVLAESVPIGTQQRCQIHWRNHLPPEVCALSAPEVLRAALGNLLGNALKFQADAGDAWILVRCLAAPDNPRGAYLEVIDNGPGIARQEAERIFSLGYRLPRDDGIPGFGIGLALTAQRLRELPGHDIRLLARARKGARFRIQFPIATARASRVPPAHGMRR